jgi:hypothetical protein
MNNDQMAEGPGQDTPAAKTKIATILRVLRRGTCLNRFDAERHHDHCLHSTVSTLEGYGLAISRRWESVPCIGGQARVRCKRYWLSVEPNNLRLADGLLAMWSRT